MIRTYKIFINFEMGGVFMASFIITTDTTSDLPEQYLQEHHIGVIPLYYDLDGIHYGGENNLTPQDFYHKMRNGFMPTTNACNPEDAKTLFLSYIQQGYAVLHIAFSSGLSSSYSNAVLAANELKESYPDAVIYIIDSLCASLGEGLLVHKAAALRDKGASMEETIQWLEENKLHLCHNFTVNDLFHLHRGGRVSKAAAILGTLVNVKPILHVDEEGHLIPLCNVRGRKKSLHALVDRMAEQISGYENDIVFISHGDSYEDAAYVEKLVKERLGIKNVLINYVSPTIGSHSGPGTVALFFMGEKR